MINACIGAHVAVTRFGDQHGIGANEALRFVKDYFHEPRIFLLPLGDGLCLWRRHDRSQFHDGAFGLRNNFLRDDKNVSVFKLHACFGGGICNLLREIVAAVNLRQTPQTQQAHIRIGGGNLLCRRAGVETLGHERRRGILREARGRFTCENGMRRKTERASRSNRGARSERCSTFSND